MYTRTLTYIFAGLIFIGFFAHLPDIGGDTPTRLLFGWTIVFALVGFFGLPALRQDSLHMPPSVICALLIAPTYLLMLGALGHVEDFSFAWTPALVLFTVASLFILLSNAALGETAFDQIVVFAVLTQALLVVGAADFPLLAAIPGPVAWPSQQVFVHGGYWQVNVMSNILSCLTLWSLWHIARHPTLTGWHVPVAMAAFILFPLVVGWSNSFSGVVFLLIGLSLISLCAWHQKQDIRGRYFMAGVGLIIVSLISASYIGLGVDTAPNVVAKAGARSMPDRLGIWLRSLYAFSEAPLFGHGLGHFASIYNDVALRYEDTQGFRWVDNMRHAHNIVLHNLVEIGLIGLLIVLGPFIWFGITLLRRYPQHWVGVAILVPIFGHMMTGYPHRQSAMPLLLVVFVMAHMGLLYGRGPQVSLSLTKFRPALRQTGLAVFVVPAMAASIWTAIAYWQASGRQMALTNPQYNPRMIPWRLSQPDLKQPFLAYHADMQAVFGLTSRAVYAQDHANLSKLLPMMEAHERNGVRGRASWSILVRGYILTGDLDKAREIMKISAALAPDWSARTMADLAVEINGSEARVRAILEAIDPNPRPAE